MKRAALFLGLAILSAGTLALALTGSIPIISPPSFSQPIEPDQPEPQLPSGFIRKLAQIEGTSLTMTKSIPPQYSLHVRYGLPSGCARPGGYEVNRSGNVVSVSVYYAMPSDPNIVCTMIYGIDQISISLGSDFVAGQNYEVEVNGKQSLTFKGL